MAASSEKKHILLISAGGSFLAPFMVSALVVAIPTIGIEFAMDAVSMSWLATVFFLAAAMFLIPFGRMADIYGVKKIFSLGIAIYFGSALLAGLSPSPLALIGARFLTGMGAAMIFGTSFALLSLSLSESERGEALGINIASSLTGFALGFFLGGLLTYYLSWRLIFLATLPVSLAVLATIRRKLPGECALSRGQRLDILGSALNAALLFFIILGLSLLPGRSGAIYIMSGLALLFIFIRVESKNHSPALDPDLFRNNRCFTFSNAAIMIYTASTLAVVFLFSLYLQYIVGLDARPAGLILLFSALVMAVLVIHAGRLSDRLNLYRLAMAGTAVSLLGLLPMTLISTSTPLWLALVELVLISAGGAFFYPPMVKIVLASISRDKYAVGSSLAETMRLIGNASSMAVVTVGFALYLRGSEIGPGNFPEFMASMRTILVVFSGLGMIALLLIYMAEKSRPRQKRGSDRRIPESQLSG